MKVITDYFVPPNLKKRRKTIDKPASMITIVDEVSEIEVDSGEESDDVYYETRKIKIRLADPDVKDSYVCEVYDTSIDEEGECPKSISENMLSSATKRNAFGLIMASKEEKMTKTKSKRGRKPKIKNQGDSSSDESLFSVKKKLRKSELSHRNSSTENGNSPCKKRSKSIKSKNISTEQVANGRRSSLPKIKPEQSNVESQCAANGQNLKRRRRPSINPITPDPAIKQSCVTPPKSDSQIQRRSARLSGQKNETEDVGKSPSVERLRAKNNLACYTEKEDSNNSKKRRTSMSTGPQKCKENEYTPEKSCITKDCLVILEKIDQAKKPQLKLAPVFLKKSKKTIVDPEILKARKKFLHSGVPRSVQKIAEKVKAQSELEVPFFPEISHVQQKLNEPEWGIRPINVKLNEVTELETISVQWKSMMHGLGQKRENVCKKRGSKKGALNIDHLRSAYKNVPIDRLYDSLKGKYSKFAKKSPQKRKSKSKIKRDDADDSPMWTVKYQPETSDILSNDTVVCKLREWLLRWKRYNDALRDGTVREKNLDDSDDDDDFVDSDEDDGRVTRAPPTACLLQGPISSGKTCLLHALASELDFNILEINASSKRNGKKILAELQEATQSHKVQLESTNVFSVSTKSGSSKDGISMIVVEEADVVFEDLDEGFVLALQTLISAAKRPVFLLTSDASAKHLDRFRSKHSIQLEMKRPPCAAACAILELIALIEGSNPPRSALLQMLDRNNNDLRQSILELQFWLSLGEVNTNYTKILQPIAPYKMWWASHEFLNKAPLWHSNSSTNCRVSDVPVVARTSDCRGETSVSGQIENLSTLVRYFDTVSVLDMLDGRKKGLFTDFGMRKSQTRDSLCLEERMSMNKWMEDEVGRDIKDELLMRIVDAFGNGRNLESWHIPQDEIRWVKSHRRAMDELLQSVPSTSTKSVNYTDYLPALRDICRAEHERLHANTKRRNRFYHYVKTLGGNPTDSNLLTNCKALATNFEGKLS